MIPGFGRGLVTSIPLSAGLLVFTMGGFAASPDSWTNASDGFWRTSSNWSSNAAPDSVLSLVLITNANAKTVTIDAGTPSTNLTIQKLTVSAPSGATNTLAILDMTTNLPLTLSSTLVVDRGGVISLTNSALTTAGVTLDHGGAFAVTNSVVKETGALSFFDIVNGNVWLDSGVIDCGAISSLRIGRTNNSAGTLTVKGGAVIASQVAVATSTSAQGAMSLSGGSLNASSLVTIGFGVNSTGTVSVAGGQLIATNNITYVGKSGFGQMTLDSGSASFAFLSVGNNADGQVTVNGGQLTMKPRTTNDWLQVGSIGNGQFNVAGGTVLSMAEFHVGDDSSGLGTGSGVAFILGGQVIATNDITVIGRYGPGTMTVSNAMMWLTNVSVGRHDGSIGTLNVQNNAQMFLLDALSIGRFSNAVGHVLVTGGLLSLTNDMIWIGREGAGDLIISNGIVRAAAAVVALSTVVTDSITMLPVTNVPSGFLTVAGGSLILTSNLLVGTSLISTGQVTVAGGDLLLADGAATLAVSSGTFMLSQGNVTADNLLLTNNTGQFIFNGGTLQAKAATVSNGLPFVVGDGTHPATFQLAGGVYSFADGLTISSNASVTGCGTILGNINNSGTLATNCPSAGVTITALAKSGSTATAYFTTIAGSNHVLEFKNSLTDVVWIAILPGVIGNGGITNKADSTAPPARRFYRIHLQ